MGVNADISVHGWRKPTLELALVAGGTLLADTKYYVAGIMNFTPSTYQGIGSPCSDVVEITTTSVNRSIQITQKTYRDITAFADNLDSRTLITSARHCVTDAVHGFVADSIKIATGSYAGTWTVDEWVDYDTFIIDTPYIDNVAVQFYTDSVYYNRPKTNYGYSQSQGMAYYVSPTDPYATGIFTTAYQWTRRPYNTNDMENPVTITAQPTNRYGLYCVIPEVARYNIGVYKCLEPYGVPTIELFGQVTPDDIYDEVQASGFIYSFGYSNCGEDNKPQMNCFAAIRSFNAGEFTVNGATVTAVSEINHVHNRSLITFNDCSINFIASLNSAGINFTAENCVIYNNSTSLTFSGWIAGSGSVFYMVPRAGNSQVDINNLYYTNLLDQQQVQYDIVQNKEYRDTGVATLWQNSNNRFKFKNSKIYALYWLFPIATHPDIYFMEDCELYLSGTYTWHIRYYSYTPANHIEIDYLNVNSDDSNNVKKCIHNSLIDITARFYRRGEFYIQDTAGAAINGAAIHIIDDDGNEYNDTTDVDGYAYLDCMEQKTVFTLDDPTTSVWASDWDTLYTDFVITISKAGYATQTIHLADLYTNEKQTVTLLASTAETVLIGSTIYGSTIQ